MMKEQEIKGLINNLWKKIGEYPVDEKPYAILVKIAQINALLKVLGKEKII